MELLPTVFSVVLVVLAIILSIVGFQVIMVLVEVKRTLKKANQAIEVAESKLNAVIQPLQKIGDMASGLKNGMKIFEAFTGWMNRNKTKSV